MHEGFSATSVYSRHAKLYFKTVPSKRDPVGNYQTSTGLRSLLKNKVNKRRQHRRDSGGNYFCHQNELKTYRKCVLCNNTQIANYNRKNRSYRVVTSPNMTANSSVNV